jgi:hypothetical protein
VTQQNAALVEESAAAAESMKEQAQGLITTVSVFKLAAAQQAVAAQAAKQAAKPAAAKASLKPVAAAGAKRAAPALVKVEAKPAANKPAPKAKVANARAGDDWEEF